MHKYRSRANSNDRGTVNSFRSSSFQWHLGQPTGPISYCPILFTYLSQQNQVDFISPTMFCTDISFPISVLNRSPEEADNAVMIWNGTRRQSTSFLSVLCHFRPFRHSQFLQVFGDSILLAKFRTAYWTMTRNLSARSFPILFTC